MLVFCFSWWVCYFKRESPFLFLAFLLLVQVLFGLLLTSPHVGLSNFFDNSDSLPVFPATPQKLWVCFGCCVGV